MFSAFQTFGRMGAQPASSTLPSPPADTDNLLLEDGTSALMLEDGTSQLLLES